MCSTIFDMLIGINQNRGSNVVNKSIKPKYQRQKYSKIWNI